MKILGKKRVFVFVIMNILLVSMIGNHIKGYKKEEDQLVSANSTWCEKVGHYTCTNFAEIGVKEDTAYITAQHNGFFVVNVSDKTNPTIIKHEKFNAVASDRTPYRLRLNFL